MRAKFQDIDLVFFGGKKKNNFNDPLVVTYCFERAGANLSKANHKRDSVRAQAAENNYFLVISMREDMKQELLQLTLRISCCLAAVARFWGAKRWSDRPWKQVEVRNVNSPKYAPIPLVDSVVNY